MLVIVNQTDHALLAGDICAHWGNDGFSPPDRPDSARIAAEIHDEGWREADEAPLFNTEERRPLHFLEIGMDEHIPLYRRGVDAAFERDPYAGLLVSMHWTGLYRARWGMQTGRVLRPPGNPEIQRLQDEAVAEEERRWIEVKTALAAEARRSDLEAGLWNGFDLLQAWDLLSLYVCLANLSAPDPDAEPTSLVPTLKSLDHEPAALVIESVPRQIAGERADLVLRPTDDAVVTIDPYPFDQDLVEFSVRARAIPDRTYDSQEDARQELSAAEEVTLTCTMTVP